MKTWKDKYKQLEIDFKGLQDRYNKLLLEYRTVKEKILKDEKIKIEDVSFLEYLVNVLQDIRKNGGAYSSVKAVELLCVLGKL